MRSAWKVGSAESRIKLFHVQEMGAVIPCDCGEGFPFGFDFHCDLFERDRLPKILWAESKVLPGF